MSNIFNYAISAIISTVFAASAILGSQEAKTPVLEPKIEVQEAYKLTPLEQWFYDLGTCESSNSEEPINENDPPQTCIKNPSKCNSEDLKSYGYYQFKRETFVNAIKGYDLFNWREWNESDWENVLKSEPHQRKIIELWIRDGVDLSRQFPQCLRQIGEPPK